MTVKVEIGTFTQRCKRCNREHRGDWSLGESVAWHCECGEMYYADPAGRVWGTEAIRHAHEKFGYFSGLLRQVGCKP